MISSTLHLSRAALRRGASRTSRPRPPRSRSAWTRRRTPSCVTNAITISTVTLIITASLTISIAVAISCIITTSLT